MNGYFREEDFPGEKFCHSHSHFWSLLVAKSAPIAVTKRSACLQTPRLEMVDFWHERYRSVLEQ
jgi:hypothetical protein